MIITKKKNQLLFIEILTTINYYKFTFLWTVVL